MLDINLIRSLFTLLMFISFVGLCIWAYSPKQKEKFDEASMLPLDDDKPKVNNAALDKNKIIGEHTHD